MLALIEIAKLQGDAIQHVNTCGARSSHGLGLGIVIECKLFAHRAASTDVAGIIDHAKNQTSQARSGDSDFFCMKNGFSVFNQSFQTNASYRKSHVLLNLRKQTISKEHICCVLD